VSLRTAKLTRRLRSEKTSRLPSPPGAGLPFEVSVPPPSGGVIIPRVDDPPVALMSSEGTDMADEFGVMMEPAETGPGGGSMSSEERKDVLSSSDIVLVIVRKMSSSPFCSDLGVPLRSNTFWKLEKE